MNESITAFYTALAEAKKAFPKIRRNKTVKVRTKTGGEYRFAYAPIEEILAAVEKPLHENGLTLHQRELHSGDGLFVETVLAHKDGYTISGQTKVLVTEQGPQAHGSGLTYARRYGLTLLLCLATDEDDDANAAEGNTATSTNGKGDRSGRPDTSGVDVNLRDEYVQGFTNCLLKADVMGIMTLHDELKTEAELYTAVSDKLSSKQRSDLRKIISENLAKKEAA